MPKPRILIPKTEIVEFCRHNQIKSLALFGSVLRAEFRPDSDVDVLVEFQPETRIGFLALSRMQRELAELFQRPVDLIPKEGLKPLIRNSVLSNTEVIYAR